jgi:hypothetical protein
MRCRYLLFSLLALATFASIASVASATLFLKELQGLFPGPGRSTIAQWSLGTLISVVVCSIFTFAYLKPSIMDAVRNKDGRSTAFRVIASATGTQSEDVEEVVTALRQAPATVASSAPATSLIGDIYSKLSSAGAILEGHAIKASNYFCHVRLEYSRSTSRP